MLDNCAPGEVWALPGSPQVMVTGSQPETQVHHEELKFHWGAGRGSPTPSETPLKYQQSNSRPWCSPWTHMALRCPLCAGAWDLLWGNESSWCQGKAGGSLRHPRAAHIQVLLSLALVLHLWDLWDYSALAELPNGRRNAISYL